VYPIINDKAVKLEGVPQPSAGSPSPVVVSDDHTLLLAYNIQRGEPRLQAGEVLTDSDNSVFAEEVAIVEFRNYLSYSFGSPNDEALNGHPLYGRGLENYAVFEVIESSWIKELEKRNSVHPMHSPQAFQSLHHYVFTFHDSTFECVAPRSEISRHREPLSALLPVMTRRLIR